MTVSESGVSLSSFADSGEGSSGPHAAKGQGNTAAEPRDGQGRPHGRNRQRGRGVRVRFFPLGQPGHRFLVHGTTQAILFKTKVRNAGFG